MKNIIIISVSFVFLLVFFQRSEIFSPEKVNTPKEKVVFRCSFDRQIHSLDPLDVLDNLTRIISSSIYDRLFEYKYLARPYELKPSLVEGFPKVSSDKLSYTFTLKEGIFFPRDPCFPEGKPRKLLAEDFVYSIKRHFDKNTVSPSAWVLKDKIVGLSEWKGFQENQPIEGLKALDDKTILIKLKAPYPQLLYALSMAFSAVVPKEAVDFYGKDFSHKSVGTGPWRIKDQTAKRLTLEKNQDYRHEVFHLEEHINDKHFDPGLSHAVFSSLEGKALPFCEEIEISFIQSSSTRWMSFLKEDELNYISIPHSFSSKVFKNLGTRELHDDLKSKYDFYYEDAPQFPFFSFNMDNPSFGYREDPIENEKNKGLRKAIRFAFNWKDFIEKRFSEQGRLFPGLVSSLFAKEMKSISKDLVAYNPQKAKELLKKFGWTKENLPILTYTGESTTTTRLDFSLFQSYMIAIGYPKNKVVLHQYSSFNDMIKEIKKSQLPSFGFLVWHMDTPDAYDLLQLLYSKNKTPGMNFSNYNNKKYDEILEKIALLSLDSSERLILIQQANELIIEDCPLISGFSPFKTHLWDKKFLLQPSFYMSYFKYIALK